MTDWWINKPTFVNPTDGIAHRVLVIRTLVPAVEDENPIACQPYTRCGSLLSVFVESCFHGADVPLTCVACASDLVLDGDRLHQQQKLALYGAMYGRAAENILKMASVKPGTYVPGLGTYNFKTYRQPRSRLRWFRRMLAEVLRA